MVLGSGRVLFLENIRNYISHSSISLPSDEGQFCCTDFKICCDLLMKSYRFNVIAQKNIKCFDKHFQWASHHFSKESALFLSILEINILTLLPFFNSSKFKNIIKKNSSEWIVDICVLEHMDSEYAIPYRI